ncbi:MAG: hypothetical protein U0271_09060 [Polyangiaceae bacterium]
MATAACDDETETIPNGPDPVTLDACLWDFDATVRMGPSVNFAIRGKVLAAIYDGGGYGEIKMDDGSPNIPVTFETEGTTMTMRFWLADGRVVVASGQGDVEPTQCTGQIDGDFIGPSEGDVGDWLGLADKSTTCDAVCRFHDTAKYCSSFCEKLGLEKGSDAHTTCKTSCEASGDQIFYCDDVAGFYDSCYDNFGP